MADGTGTSDGGIHDVIVALTCAPTDEVAAQLARALVDERLAACVNLVPKVRSIYRFEGKVHDDAEVLCVIKTRRACVTRLGERLAALHPYQVPELVILDVSGGLPAYLAWVTGEVAAP